jgi:hypothetical protein
MNGVIHFEPEDARPSPEDVLSAQELPVDDALPGRLRDLLEEAFQDFDTRTEPRAITAEISRGELEEVLDGFDGPVEESVIGRTYPRGEAFALYVGTLGAPLADRIRELFATGDLGGGWMLDAVASSGADRLSDLLAARFEEELADRGSSAPRVLPYSPGYCGWSVRGQQKLFARLQPGEIGVTLNDSCLMTPIKSVSGVLVAGEKEIHRFRPDFDFCDECKTRSCAARMASVLRR